MEAEASQLREPGHTTHPPELQFAWFNRIGYIRPAPNTQLQLVPMGRGWFRFVLAILLAAPCTGASAPCSNAVRSLVALIPGGSFRTGRSSAALSETSRARASLWARAARPACTKNCTWCPTCRTKFRAESTPWRHASARARRWWQFIPARTRVSSTSPFRCRQRGDATLAIPLSP